jgi:hypothetical protein
MDHLKAAKDLQEKWDALEEKRRLKVQKKRKPKPKPKSKAKAAPKAKGKGKATEAESEDEVEDDDESVTSEGSATDTFHYIAYVPVGNRIWELDGLKMKPAIAGKFWRST